MNPSPIFDREILDRLHDAVISTDLEGIVIDLNQAAECIYEHPRQELIGKSVACLYPESELPKMGALIKEVMATGHADGEFLNCTKSGKEIFIHLSVSLMRDSQQQPCGMIGFSIDITNHRRAERERREVEESDRAARAASGVGTWYWDLTNDRLRWDEISSSLLGTTPDEKQSFQVFLQHVHPQDRSRVELLVKKCIETGEELSTEYRTIQPDGSSRWIAARGRVVLDTDGKPERMLGTGTDITKHKLSEEKLRRTEAKYRVLFESPLIGVASGNVEHFTDANETYCRMLGYSREELLSGMIRWQDITPEEFLARDFEALQSLAQRGVCEPFEKEYIRRDGTRIRVLLGAAVLSREPFEWSCFVLDISAQQRAKIGLRMSEQMAAAARMGSSLAHEINNPLASLTNVLYLLRYGPSSMPREELLISADESLDRVSRITRQMIGIYSQSETISDVKLQDILEDTLAGLAGPIRTKNIHLENRNEFGKSSFYSNEADVRRVVWALMENAVEHAPVGGKVKVHLYKGREWSNSSAEGLKIVVSDNGPGIDQERLPSLFEPFVSTKTRKASGLGLWVTKSIVSKYDGRLKLRTSTRRGQTGTCIAVFLQEASNRKAVSLVM